MILYYWAVPEKNPYSPHGRDWSRGFWKTKNFKEIYEAQLEFPEGWGGLGKNPFPGGGMNIFWNYTLLRNKSKT